jgi:hypothetical protein
MPAFVIHAFGQPPRKVVIDSSPIRVGRDPTADIVINEPAVSRDHAMFLADENGKWLVSCVSDTNPILVDGAIITAGTLVREGSEVLVGTSHMIIFSENAFTANQYVEGKRHFEQGACEKCKWSGLVSSLSKDPKCPRCAAALKTAVSYGSDARRSNEPMDVAERRAAAVGTAQMPLDQAQGMWAKIKAAKLSRLERVDGRDPDKAAAPLGDGKVVELSRRPGADLRLAGFVFGRVEIAWAASGYVAKSALSLASMKVNGKKVESAPLANGDVIEVGSNRFRFVTGKGAGA